MLLFFLTVFSLRRFFAAMKLEIIWHFSFSFTSILMQYYKQTEAYKVTLHYMNTTLTGLFTLECVMKIFSFGFRVCRYGAIQLRHWLIFHDFFTPTPLRRQNFTKGQLISKANFEVFIWTKKRTKIFLYFCPSL